MSLIFSSVVCSGATHVLGLEETQEERLASVVPDTMAIVLPSIATILSASSRNGCYDVLQVHTELS